MVTSPPLSAEEAAGLIFQSGRSRQRGGRGHNPYAFTVQKMTMESPGDIVIYSS
jgi:hypothetical protein